jgi:hypothetical protein
MLTLVVILLTALIPTAQFDWFDWQSGPNITSPAYCAFEQPISTSKASFSTMISSVLLLSLGFLSRAIRLHRWAVVSVIDKARKFLSRKARSYLRTIYDWSGNMSAIGSIKRTLVYYPVLAVFLVIRVTLDMYASMFFEVSLSQLEDIDR